MSEVDQTVLSAEEIEDADGAALPDREAMSVVDPTGGGDHIVLVEEIPPPPLAD
jgi:hypothetical protein